MPGRKYNGGDYRYGFNGKENDNEIKGEGNSIDFGARMYDSRLGRWFAVDPLASKYPNMSPYNFVGNSPLMFVDPDGKDIHVTRVSKGGENGKDLIIMTINAKWEDQSSRYDAVLKIKSKLDNQQDHTSKKYARLLGKLNEAQTEYEAYKTGEIEMFRSSLTSQFKGKGESVDWEMKVNITEGNESNILSTYRSCFLCT